MKVDLIRTRLTMALAAVYVAGCSQPAEDPALPTVTALVGAAVFDAVSDEVLEDAVVVVDGDRIAALGRRGEIEVPAGARTLDVGGKTIIPALVDLHTHIGITVATGFHADNYTPENIERDANRYLYYGVGQVLSLGFDRQAIFAVREAQGTGAAGGARLATSGRGFSAVGGWAAPVALGNTVESEWTNRPATVEEARALVREEATKGVDAIKIWVDDLGGSRPKFGPEMYGAIIDEAHLHEIPVIAHIVELEDAKELMRRGVDALTHIARQDVDEEFLTLARDHGVSQIPTLVTARNALDYSEEDMEFWNDPGLSALYPEDVLAVLSSEEFAGIFSSPEAVADTRLTFPTAMRSTGRIAAAGIPVALGTDAGTPGRFQGLWAHRELELLVEAGLTPAQALRAGTVNAALGLDDRIGTLEPGKHASFIILDGDPLEDIRNTRRIDSVWLSGQEIDRAALARSARGEP